MKFRKREIEKYKNLISYVREEMATGRDFWSSLFSGGLTFTEDIKRFHKYCLQEKILDIIKELEYYRNFRK